MKLLLTLDYPPEFGGIQRYLHDIVTNTYLPEDIVVVGCVRAFPPKKETNDSVQIEYHSCALSRINKKFSLIPLFLRLIHFQKNKTSELSIECGNIYAAILPWILSFFVKMPYTVYAYGTELLLQGKPVYAFLFRRVLRSAEYINVISSYADRLVKNLGVVDKTRYVPCKIQLNDSMKRWKNSESIPRTDSVFRILCVARFVKHKGQRYLVDAVSSLSSDISWELVFVGEGPEKEQIQEFVKTVHIADKVTFHSAISDEELAKLYRLASVFVLPSIESSGGVEGFGIVLLEAMAWRVPIIASASGGITDVLDNGTCGLLVSPGNSAELTSALCAIHGDTELKKHLIENAWNRLQKKYVW